MDRLAKWPVPSVLFHGLLGTCALLCLTRAASSGPYSEAVLSDAPVAYWRLGETDASMEATNLGLLGQDGIGHGTYTDASLLGEPSLVAGETDGSFRAAPDSAMATDFFDKFSEIDGFGGTGVSVEFWTAFEQVPGVFANLVGDGAGGLNFNLMVYAGAGGFIRPHIQTDTGFSSIDSVRQLIPGEIVHVVSTWDYDSGDFRLYLDGQEAEVINSAGAVPNVGEPINIDNPIFIGQDQREPSPRAWIDEVAIYNYPLEAATIQQHYDLGKGAPSPLPEPPQPFPDPGNLPGLPEGLVTYIDFDEADAPGPQGELDFAYDRQGANDGRFQGNATRVAGLIGRGAASFDNSGGTQVSLGPGVDDSFSVTQGVTLEALIQPQWSGGELDYDEIFRKEDGGNRILFSFQNDSFGAGALPPVDPGPVLSFGLNTAGYSELDMPLDVDLSELEGGSELSGTIWLNDPGEPLGPNDVVLNDGDVHHAVATYDSASGEKAIWIDGVKRWSYQIDGGEIVSGGGAVAYIGATNGGENFTGVIDEFAFWNRALSADEIAAHYENASAGLNYFGSSAVPGDFDGNGILDTADIDELTRQSAAATHPAGFDLTGDGLVNVDDVRTWVKDLKNSWVGDANLDGEFNSSDLVSVLAAGTYEVNAEAVWSSGDFNGDGRFNSSDLVAALADGGYEQGPRAAAAVAAVPEPSGLLAALIAIGTWAVLRRR